MEIGELKQIIKGNITTDSAGRETLVVTGSLLKSDTLGTIFATYLDGDSLRITITEPHTETGDSITVYGTGQNTIFEEMPLAAQFSTIASEAGLFLTAEVSSEWNFPVSFPNLQDTFFADFEFVGLPSFYLASHDRPGVADHGLSFSGSLRLASALSHIAWLLGEQSAVDIHGNIMLQNGDPHMTLATDPVGPINLGFLKLPSVTLELVSLVITTGDETPQEIEDLMRLRTAVSFQAKDGPVSIPMMAEFRDPKVTFLLYADLNQVIDAAFDQLADLFDGADLSSVLPGDLAVGDLVQLDNLILQVNPEERKLVSVRAGVESAQSWTIIEDLISIERLGLGFMLKDPLGTKELSMGVFGEIGLGG